MVIINWNWISSLRLRISHQNHLYW